MKLSSWGKYPVVESEVFFPASDGEVLEWLNDSEARISIPRGLGRSYGDSALAPVVLSSKYLDHFYAFDEESGLLSCAAGVSLADVLRYFVPKGWFLPVTPGTKFVSVGGAIASDVHGKNHHLEGSFSDYVIELTVATVAAGIVSCSRSERPELFYATCGGMGLTGFILKATFRLKRIKSSRIDETIVKARNLEEALTLFEENKGTTYSVAWIDCLSTGDSMGRSLLMLGEHAEEGELTVESLGRFKVPFDMPGFLLNSYSVQAFNYLYYNRIRKKSLLHKVHYEPFFYPLDGILEWNKIYGKSGFVQYQFVLPIESGLEGMVTVLKKIAESKLGSFLAVLKKFGKGNENYLSFPMEGYTLALDFKMGRSVLDLLNELDSIVLDFGGRVYLTKDARMSEHVFKHGYPHWSEFQAVRESYRANEIFNSLQSQRIGL